MTRLRHPTRIFLDGADPREVSTLITQLGFLDGVTTNPSLVAKNPSIQARLASGEKLSNDELLNAYKGIAVEIANRHATMRMAFPTPCDISLEVYADASTTVDAMTDQSREMAEWVPGARIKLPITRAGLRAASRLVALGIRVNMTLCFSQHQAAAVHAATRGAAPDHVVISPFVGRLDDIGLSGITLISHISSMYTAQKSHVRVLAASLRSPEHVRCAMHVGADIVTAPSAVLQEWVHAGSPMTIEESSCLHGEMIPWYELDLGRSWRSFDIAHELTKKGLAKFAADWNALIAK